MINSQIHNITITEWISAKLVDLGQLVKMRLTMLVVFSSIMGYLFASSGTVNWMVLFGLSLGGFFITACSNTLNQIYEKRIDAIMKRTIDRPIAAARMSSFEGVLWALIFGVIGIILLTELTNSLTALFATFSMITYAFLYTPLKRVSRISVYIGAFPGAMPFLLGWVACLGTFTFEAGLLFLIQFIWQLPHTWSIAWLLKSDYRKVGIKMMPTNWRDTKIDASYVLITSLLLIVATLLPFVFNQISYIGLFGTVLSGSYFVLKCFNLFINRDEKAAKGVLMGSILFLPVMQIFFVIDKVVL